MLAPPAQARHLLDLLLPIPDFHLVHVQPRLHLLADQPARHRVHVAVHIDQAARVHLHPLAPGRLHAPFRQLLHHRHLFGQPLPATGVQPLEHRFQKTPVLVHAGKIHAAAQHQLLRHCSLEAMMPLLHIAVLVPMTGLCLLALQPVVVHQTLVTIRELSRIAHVVDRRRKPVSPMTLRHLTQRPQRVLQPLTQTLEALRKTHRSRFPVCQHEVIDQVRKTLPLDGHAQLFHVREVRRSQPPRWVLLREEHLPGRSLRRTPTLHPTLQRAQLPINFAFPNLEIDIVRLVELPFFDVALTLKEAGLRVLNFGHGLQVPARSGTDVLD